MSEQAEAAFACCSKPSEERAADPLLCEFGELSVPAAVDGDVVTCKPPQAEALFTDPEAQGVRLRVTAKGKGAAVHEETLDRATFEARSAGGGAPPPAAEAPQQLQRAPTRGEKLAARYSALKPFCIISLSYLGEGNAWVWGGARFRPAHRCMQAPCSTHSQPRALRSCPAVQPSRSPTAPSA